VSMAMTAVAAVVLGQIIVILVVVLYGIVWRGIVLAGISLNIIRQYLHHIAMVSGLVFVQMICG